MDRIHELLNYAFKKPGGPTEPSPPPKTVLNAIKTGVVLEDTAKLSKDVPPGIKEFFHYIKSLDFKQDPDYHLMKSILADALKKLDVEYDGRFSFSPVKKHPVAKVAAKLKKTTLGGTRKALKYSDTEDDSQTDESDKTNDKKTGRGRTLRERRAIEKKATIVVPAKAAAASGRSSSKPRPKPIASSCSEPNQLTPQKTAATTNHTSAPLNNPTPAMIELMQRINQKKALAAKGKPIASKLLTNAVITQNKSVAKKATIAARSVPRADGDLPEPVKRRPGRPVSPKKAIVSNGAKRTQVERSKSPPEIPAKRGPGRPKSSPSSVISPKLSSNSSTHSTKENKYVVPTRRSPRAVKK